MPLYYYDEDGYKVGPINKKELFALVEQGKIAPNTRLTDGKNETKAKHVTGLKFVAPEYHRAEEIFDPKNIDLDSMPNMPNSVEIISQEYQPYNTAREKQEKITALKSTEPKLQRVKEVAKAFVPQNTIYWYFHFTLKTYYPIASFIFYGGLSLTALISLASLASSVPFMSVFCLLIGTFLSIFISYHIGIIADFVQWLLTIEQHLQEMNNRQNQNDLDG